MQTKRLLINWSAVRIRDGPPANKGSYDTGRDSLFSSWLPWGYPLENLPVLDPPASVPLRTSKKSRQRVINCWVQVFVTGVGCPGRRSTIVFLVRTNCELPHVAEVSETEQEDQKAAG